MIRFSVLLSWFLFLPQAVSSTFIGNGGNAGDFDLSVSLSLLQKTLEKINASTPKLCSCSENLIRNNLCLTLESLNQTQVSFCQTKLLQYRKRILELANKDSSVIYEWSGDSLNVIEHNHNVTRLVDAIAQDQTRKIILDRQRFLDLSPSYRVALLTHELFHLVEIDGHYLTDDQSIGPFSEGKNFLDSLGAAVAVIANASGVSEEFSSLENVSRSHKKYFFNLDLRYFSHSQKVTDNLIIHQSVNSSALVFEYKPGPWAWRLGIETWVNVKIPLTDLTVQESNTLLNTGVSYQWFPVRGSLSRWSESYIATYVEALYGVAKYSVKDPLTEISAQSPIYGMQLGGQYRVPIVSGFWGTLGFQIRYLQYRFAELNISVSEIHNSYNFGGAYAF